MKNRIEQLPQNWQAGLCLSALSFFKRFSSNPTAVEICNHFEVSTSKAYLDKVLIEELLLFELEDGATEHQEAAPGNNHLMFKIEVLEFEAKNPGIRKAGERNHFKEDYKKKIIELKKKFNLTWDQISLLLIIPVETLKKFTRATVEKDESIILSLTPELVEMINKYLQSAPKCKSTKEFFHQNTESILKQGYTYKSFCKLLLGLGLTSPSGIFKAKTVLDRLIRFNPNMIWGTDGKMISIDINGIKYKWIWQCLIDFKTTVIVGGLVSNSENTENLFSSLEDAAKKWTTPLAIVLDNRLSENLPVIRKYLDEHDIQIIKTFPGNPKSNGITEGNFSIFEHYMGGEIKITGNTEEDLSKSIAEMLVEVFTQLRNHTARGRHTKTPSEAALKDHDINEEELNAIKKKITEIANRFKDQLKSPIKQEEKLNAIEQVIEEIVPPHPEVVRKSLSNGRYNANLIMEALAILKTQKTMRPDKKYGHHYYAGILNNVTEEKYLGLLHQNLDSIGYENIESLKKLNKKEVAMNLAYDSVDEMIRLCTCFMTMPIPSYQGQILGMIKECFLIASKGSSVIAVENKNKIAGIIIKSMKYKKSLREILIKRIHEWTKDIIIYNEFKMGHVGLHA